MLCHSRSRKSSRKSKSYEREEQPEEIARPPAETCAKDAQTEGKPKDSGRSLASSDDINWEDFNLYEEGKVPEFMKEINNPRAVTQRRASRDCTADMRVRRRSNAEVSMTTASSQTRRKSRDNLTNQNAENSSRKMAGHSGKEGAEAKEEEEKCGSEATSLKKMNNYSKVSVMKEISESHNDHVEDDRDDNDESGAENGSLQKNHGSIPSVGDEGSTLDPKDDILAQITARINKLAKHAPDWLTDVLRGDIQPASLANRKPAYRRLAHRAGARASADLKARLLSSVG